MKVLNSLKAGTTAGAARAGIRGVLSTGIAEHRSRQVSPVLGGCSSKNCACIEGALGEVAGGAPGAESNWALLDAVDI